MSRSPYVSGQRPIVVVGIATGLADNPPDFFVYAMAVITILLALVVLGRALLGLARDWRRYRNGD